MSEKKLIFVPKSKRMSGLSLWVFPKGYKANKEGKAPLFLRISLNRERAEIALKRFINPNHWDNKRQLLKGRNPDASSINEQIRVYKVTLHDYLTKLLKEGEIPSAKKLKDAFEGVGSNGKTLLETFNLHNQNMEKQIGKTYAKGTYKRYETCLKLIAEFLKLNYHISDIPLDKIKLEFITNFASYLRTTRNCNNNTTYKYVKNLRKILNEARAFEWMQQDPFLNYKSKLEAVDREILTKAEIETLTIKSFDVQRLEYIKDIFLFCCFTGLAFCDAKKLAKENIIKGIDGENWIQINRTKTSTMCKIPIFPIAQMILDKYTGNPECIKEDKLLPIPSNQKYNAYLKEVAACCNINKNLTSHMARHTFATTVTLSNNVPMETVSKLLGHTSIKTTQQYSKVLEGKISEDTAFLRSIFKPSNPLKVVNE